MGRAHALCVCVKLVIVALYPNISQPCGLHQKVQQICCWMFKIPLPNGLIKVRRRWGQRHPQGANSGSNGKLN
jgi:hypothetical protein